MSRRRRLPAWTEGGSALRLIVGTYAGRTAPTDALLADLLCRRWRCRPAPSSRCRPSTRSARSTSPRALIMVGDRQLGVGDLAVLAPGQPVEALAGPDGAKAMLLGGAADGWPASHLVELRLLEQGAHREGQGRLARAGRFAKVPGRSGVHPAAGSVERRATSPRRSRTSVVGIRCCPSCPCVTPSAAGNLAERDRHSRVQDALLDTARRSGFCFAASPSRSKAGAQPLDLLVQRPAELSAVAAGLGIVVVDRVDQQDRRRRGHRDVPAATGRSGPSWRGGSPPSASPSTACRP